VADEPSKQWVHYVVYGPNQREHPGRFVVRKWTIRAEGPSDAGLAGVVSGLREARRLVPPGHHNLGRSPGDDPSIVEVWI
jgi:hypothetical protein